MNHPRKFGAYHKYYWPGTFPKLSDRVVPYGEVPIQKNDTTLAGQLPDDTPIELNRTEMLEMKSENASLSLNDTFGHNLRELFLKQNASVGSNITHDLYT